jgi:hypothetical protein
MMVLHRKFQSRSAALSSSKDELLKFQQLRLVAPQFDAIVLHALIHEFRVRAGICDMDIALYDKDH